MHNETAVIQNETVRGRRTSPDRKMKFNLTVAVFLTLAVALAFASVREPLLVSRMALFVLAALSAAAPFLFFAIGSARDRREQLANANALAKRQDQTRREIRRAVETNIATLCAHRAANDDPQAWRNAVARFAADDIFPAISHAVPRSEREMWLMEILVFAEAFTAGAAAPAEAAEPMPDDARAFTEDCARRIAATGWETTIEGSRVIARRGDHRTLFQCLHVDAPIDEHAVEAFRARLAAAGDRGAIVANQPYTPAALQSARASGLGLIKPEHIAPFLEWAASGAAAPARAAV